MKSIEPKSGPSFMYGVGSLAVAVFAVLWTVLVVWAGTPVIVPIIGVIFVLRLFGENHVQAPKNRSG